MKESDEEDLFELFTRMGFHLIPPKNSMKPAIKTRSHEAILQEPTYIFDCFSTPMVLVQQKLLDSEHILFWYETKKATGKSVAIIERTEMMRELKALNHLRCYVKNTDQTKRDKSPAFLYRFLSSCLDKITVCLTFFLVTTLKWKSSKLDSTRPLYLKH